MMKRLGWMIGVTGFGGTAQLAGAQVIAIDLDTPSSDVWNYPFSTTPGTRETAPTFGAILFDGFDDRDSQFVVAFNTDGDVPAGLALDQYHVRTVVITATVSNDEQFLYDPTSDSYATFLPIEDPESAPDTDAGRPIELFGVDFRGGLTSATWTETGVLVGAAAVEPAQESRRTFAAAFDDAGVGTDVSNNLKQRFDVAPWAVGMTGAVTPGDAVPVDTTFTFEIDLCQPGARAYMRRALADGRLILTLTSQQDAAGGPGGGEGVIYPVWYTRENVLADILGLTATLDLEVRVGNAADLDANGALNVDDIDAFVTAFLGGSAEADFDGNCSLNVDDIDAFVTAFLGG
ncbi:MAG: hypothetical protein DHS20C14_18500 [Phycisphaeraceae bacterium]|nr:MAG: hypothetical protein DHS20C14_18500 [Phycisphaeraceae bacterium]